MRCHERAFFLAVLTVLCACGGGGSTSTITTLPQANPTVNAPSGNARSVHLSLEPTSARLPVVSQITGTLLFPAVGTPSTIALSASATAPAGVALKSMRRAQSGTLTTYEYFTIVSPITTSLPSIPAIMLHFPASTPLRGKSVYYGISDLNAEGGLVSFNTQGPATIDGQTVSFAQVPTSITFEAGHKYTFVVYATGTAPVKVGAAKIYVANMGSSPNWTASVTTYSANGSQTTPTISTGLNGSYGVAVDAAGKIYVSNYDGNNVTTYNADGSVSTPTITAGVNLPQGMAVDAAGKIYVANIGASSNNVTTYNANGSQTAPTISAGLRGPFGVAVDSAGKIYVANQGSFPDYAGPVTTYNADGSLTTPIISAGLNVCDGVAVDTAGKIYVTNFGNNTVTTYNADGSETTPTITVGVNAPAGVAVDAAGKIYVANAGNNTVTTYNADGTTTTPTITAGLDGPRGVAVH